MIDRLEVTGMETFLGIVIVILLIICWIMKNTVDDFKKDYIDLERRIGNIDLYEKNKKFYADAYFNGKISNLKSIEKQINEKQSLVQNFLSSKISDFPILAVVISDYETSFNEYVAAMLEIKKPHAFKAADEVRHS